MKDPGNMDDLDQRSFSSEGEELESDENRVWKPVNVPNECICRHIASSISDAQVMDLDTVVRSELPMYITDVDSHAKIFIVRRKVQIISDAGRTA